jgi:hypothetical protein
MQRGCPRHAPKSKCGRASHPTAFVRGFLFCLVTARWRNDRFSLTALAQSAECRRCLSQLPIRHLATTNLQPLRRPAALGPAPCFLLQRARSKEQAGEEAAMPGQPVALARVFWSVPRRFTLENRRLPLALPQSFGKLRKLHVSLDPLSARLLRLATQKSRALVQKLWTMRLPCGSPRKTKN